MLKEEPIRNPREVYQERLALRVFTENRLDRRYALVSYARLLVFFGALILIWPVYKKEVSPAWLALPAASFLGLLVLHETIARARGRARAAAAYYRRGLSRLEDKWHGDGPDGSTFARPEHPYAADFDLFGRGSLFQFLCRARTQAGEKALADCLLDPVEPAETILRQQAVRELAPGLDFREDLAVLGAETRAGLDPARIVSWSSAPSVLPSAGLRIVAFVLTGLALLAAGAWAAGLARALPLFLVIFVQILYRILLNRRYREMIRLSDGAMPEFPLLAALLRRIEAETFQAPRLRELRARLDTAGLWPSRRLKRLRVLQDCFDARRNALFFPLAFPTLWDVHFAFALESWRIRYGRQVPLWLSSVGDLEALASLGCHAFENPAHVYPEIVETGEPIFEGFGLGHPLLPDAVCVRNDLVLDEGRRLYIVSGSNMSGKSTWLRTVGTLCVLAYAGAPVRARSLRLSRWTPAASIRVIDSLLSGVSHFYAEIQRLQRIVSLARTRPPVLFLVDEVLQGTNSHDRFVGTEAVLRTLLGRGARGMITTHDLALTSMAESQGPGIMNVHFRDELLEGRLHFTYHLHPGVIERSNALDLMRAVGLEV